MSELVHYEYPPPRSWEQFEELCADLFEVMWSDPSLVRHGRAGQVQFGVDIVAARGGIYPVGLQCKKKSRWPAKRLTVREVEKEILEAEKFRPELKELYILTTAVSDESLQKHLRTLNEARKKHNKFPVEVLFWTELVRRVARFEQVAAKHFSVGGSNSFSPLLATWYTKGGKLERQKADWHLAVRELGEDFDEWPTGHVVVRQRETDEMLGRLHSSNAASSSKDRANRLDLRRELRHMRNKERSVQETIRMLYTNSRLKFCLLDLDESGVDAQDILKAIIEGAFRQDIGSVGDQKIRLRPPTPHLLTGPLSSMSVAADDLPVNITDAEYAMVLNTERDFPKRFYGNQIVQVVSELPKSVRAIRAIPAIVRRVERIMSEDRKSLADMELAGYLDVDAWTYTH